MGQASSSTASTTGINAPGGSINKIPSAWLIAIAAVVLVFWLGLGKRRR